MGIKVSALPDSFKLRNITNGVVIDVDRLPGNLYRCEWQDLFANGAPNGSRSSYNYSAHELERSKELEIYREGEVKLADKFVFVYADARHGTVFSAERVEYGYRVSWLDDGYSDFRTTHYTEDFVKDFIIRGRWIVKGVTVPEVSLETSEEEACDGFRWPFPPSTFVEPEFLPPDDIEPVADFGISLLDIRNFCSETGFRIEVDRDFYTVRKESHEDVYVAETEDGLTAIIGAIRVLTRAVDKG